MIVVFRYRMYGQRFLLSSLLLLLLLCMVMDNGSDCLDWERRDDRNNSDAMPCVEGNYR